MADNDMQPPRLGRWGWETILRKARDENKKMGTGGDKRWGDGWR